MSTDKFIRYFDTEIPVYILAILNIKQPTIWFFGQKQGFTMGPNCKKFLPQSLRIGATFFILQDERKHVKTHNFRR